MRQIHSDAVTAGPDLTFAPASNFDAESPAALPGHRKNCINGYSNLYKSQPLFGKTPDRVISCQYEFFAKGLLAEKMCALKLGAKMCGLIPKLGIKTCRIAYRPNI